MPPKKEEEEPVVLLGRFGTSLKIGIVGLPNVGYVLHKPTVCDWSAWSQEWLARVHFNDFVIHTMNFPSIGRKSTFFNVLTSSEVPAENFPFCTKGMLYATM